MALQALPVLLLGAYGGVQFWEIGLLAVILGLNNTFENPARQAFVPEMAGPHELRSAVSLNSALANVKEPESPAPRRISAGSRSTSGTVRPRITRAGRPCAAAAAR